MYKLKSIKYVVFVVATVTSIHGEKDKKLWNADRKISYMHEVTNEEVWRK